MKRIYLWLCLMVMPACAQELSWDANEEPEVIGYKIYYGFAPGDRQFVLNVGLVTKYRFALAQDTWFVVTAYNAYLESGYSEEVVYSAPGNSCDCNKDGKVDASDYALIRKLIGQDKYVNGILNPRYDENCDIYKDEKIDALDRVYYKKRCQ